MIVITMAMTASVNASSLPLVTPAVQPPAICTSADWMS